MVNDEPGSQSNPLDSAGLCLLSLDGGGVRGLSSLYILKGLMARLNYERQAAKLPLVKPCEVFDLIGGTSTGGLIAIMLGRLGMDVDDCITEYSELMKTVFETKSSWVPVSWKFKTASQFDSVKLQSAIAKVIKGHSASESDLFNDQVDRSCKVFVCATAKETKSIARLRSYSVLGQRDSLATICEAALATSAATTFFDPVSIGARTYVDGALGTNNPVDEVESETSNIWCPDTRDPKPLVKCFISVGTGNPGKKAIEDNVLKFMSKTLVDITTETEKTANKFIERWAQHFEGKRYFRFNVHQGLQDVGLAECQHQGTIEATTDEYLDDQEQRSRVRDCVLNLKQKQRKTDNNFPSVIIEHNRIIGIQSCASNKPCWSVPFERNHRFVGRASQLSDLQTNLFAERQSRKFALIGLGGIGKTQIALELAYRVRESYTECSIFWIPATNIESLQQAYLELGLQLKIPGIGEKQADVRRLVQLHLSKENACQWLLIFDNADDIDMWTKTPPGNPIESPCLIDCLPRHTKGAIVITTRSRKNAVRLAQQNVVKITEMDEDIATQVLRNSLINQEVLNDRQAKMKLLQQLIFLPLAIVQAAAYINKNDMTLSKYLDLLEKKEEDVIELLAEDFEDEGRYRNAKNPVATTWLISFKQIQHHDPLAAEYLSFMSCLEPKSIPQSLLPPAQSKKQMEDAIGTLSAYSFITQRSVDQAFDLHRLVHLATRNWLRMEDTLAVWTAKSITRLSDDFPTVDHTHRSVWQAYLPHVRHILRSELVEDETKDRLQLLEKFGFCQYLDGKYKEAENSLMQLREIKQRVLEQEHPLMLTITANLALTYRNQGQWKKAEGLEVQVLEASKRVLGEEHPDTLTSMHNLVSTYRGQGRWKEAEGLVVQVLEASKRVLGEEHPGTIASIANLASTYRNQGQWKKAEGLEVQVLEASKRVLGEEHPDTMASISNLASIYRNQGQCKKAEGLEVQVLEASKRVLGEEHPNTLSSMAHLASTYSNQGRLKEAEGLEVQVLEARKKVQGEEHPDTLNSIANLALTYQVRGRWKEAEGLEVQVLEARKRLLGEEHPHTLSSMANLASTYRNQGRLKEAEGLEVQVLEARKKLLGEEHPNTLSSMANLASTYRNQGRWKEAEELGVQVLEARKNMLGEEHPKTLTSMHNLASTYRNQGRWKEAEGLEMQVLEASKKVLGEEHPDTLSSMANLASIYWDQGRWKEAEELDVQVLEARKRVLGEEHPDTLTSIANLALTYQDQGRWKKAEGLDVQVLEARKRVLGEEHPDTLTSMANLASTYRDQGRWKEAEELEVQVLEARKRLLGEEHPDTLMSMHNLAFTWKFQGFDDKALGLMTECLERRILKIGSDHPEAVASLEALTRWRMEQSSKKNCRPQSQSSRPTKKSRVG